MKNQDKRKCIFWTSSIYDLVKQKSLTGGLAVQLSLWMNIFHARGWTVYTFGEENLVEDSRKIYLSERGKLLSSVLLKISHLVKIRPNVVIVRGAQSHVVFLALLARILRFELIFMGASDTDFIRNCEIMKSPIGRWFYRLGIKHVENFVVQNVNQQLLLKSNYNKDSLLIPNIWDNVQVSDNEKKIDCIWVANFRALKRPEWFLGLAKLYPDFKFQMIGGALDSELYNRCREMADAMPNVDFVGALPLKEVTKRISESRVLVCTSEVEGFPNTFLQAWSMRVPVLSTFDPSGVIAREGVGFVAGNLDELSVLLRKILADEQDYNIIRSNIENYFTRVHCSETQYEKLVHTYLEKYENS